MKATDQQTLEMLDVLTDLEISESNGRFQRDVATAAIAAGYRRVEDMTVGDLRALILRVRDEFNAVERGAQ